MLVHLKILFFYIIFKDNKPLEYLHKEVAQSLDKQDKDCFLESFEAYEDSLVPLDDPEKGIYDFLFKLIVI